MSTYGSERGALCCAYSSERILLYCIQERSPAHYTLGFDGCGSTCHQVSVALNEVATASLLAPHIVNLGRALFCSTSTAAAPDWTVARPGGVVVRLACQR